jgi:putative ABC transport system permease protein
MLTVTGAFDKRLDEIKAEIGTTVHVLPLSAFLGPLGDNPNGDPEPITVDEIEALEAIGHVESASPVVMIPYQGDELRSGVDSSDLGRAVVGSDGTPLPDFEIPIRIAGADSATSTQLPGVGTGKIVDGRDLMLADQDKDVAVLGEAVAQENGLGVGDLVTLNDARLEVVGIISTDSPIGDTNIFLPLDTHQRLFDSEEEISRAQVKVDEVDNVEGVAEEIRTALGGSRAIVTSETGNFESVRAPLADAHTSSRIGLVAALVASAATILISVGLVTRQRVKEIGILKAVGASNWHLTAQFGIETVVVTVVAALVGALATFPLAQSVADGLVSDPVASVGPSGFATGRPGVKAIGIGGPEGAGGLLGDIDVAVSPELFLYALGIAIGLAIVASTVPAWYVARVKPAEVLRHE